MKSILLIIGVGLFTCTFCIGQNLTPKSSANLIENLIPNAGFEYSWRCPNSFSQINSAIGWSNPTMGTSDYYNACNKDDYSVPKNRYGEKAAFGGNAYAALHGSKFTREYIQVRLKEPLEKGVKYSCSIRISACERYGTVCSDVGMLFTKEKIKKDNCLRIVDHRPQIENHPDSLFTDYEWHRVSGHFIANGGEEYLTIGSFRKYVSSVEIESSRAVNDSWYNFIDNVSTEPIYRKKPKKKIQASLDRLQNINFENRSHDLKADSLYKLKKVLKILIRNKDICIKVVGHTDNNGSKTFNKNLSTQRCHAVKQYLVKHGVSKNRIKTEGKGDSTPLLPNSSEENRTINRRVEFKVI
jgi:OOP family OmpA-OmpF porin